MSWVRIRSHRDPAFWAPLAAALLLALLVAIGAQLWVTDHIRHLRAVAEADPRAAAVAAGQTLRAMGWLLGGFALLSSAVLGRFCQLGLRQGRLPPGGWWSLGARRAAIGTTAQRLGRVGLGLSALLAVLGIATVLLVEHLIEVLPAAQLAA